MLHSALPRAYLAQPGLGYHHHHHHPHLAGSSYFEEATIAAQQHPYAYLQQHQQQQQHLHLDPESYAAARLMSEQRVLAWDTTSSSSSTTSITEHPPLALGRAASPCPLDLSLKPAPSPPPSAPEYEAIEVDDEEDRRSREEARSRHSSESRTYPFGGRDIEEDVVVDDLDSQRSCSSAHSYHPYERHQLSTPKKLESTATSAMGALTPQDAERLRVVQEMSQSLAGYPEHQQKLLLASPTHLHTYHQLQLLQTPQHHQAQPQQQQQQHAHHLQGIHAPMTPPSTPSPPQCPRRKNREEDTSSPGGSASSSHTPSTPKQSHGSDKPRAKKKHARKLKFDEDTSSPVSGTVILGPDEAVVTGDIDPAFNIVEVTEEARAELAKIENRLGPYQCKLCRQLHEDAFQLAQHRCSRIAHVEYRCPECDKRFSCPANLASHRRWHKPRPGAAGSTSAGSTSAAAAEEGNAGGATSTGELACARCEAKFSRQAALRKHVAAQHPNEQNNNNNNQENDNRAEGEDGKTREQLGQQVGSEAVAMEMA